MTTLPELKKETYNFINNYDPNKLQSFKKRLIWVSNISKDKEVSNKCKLIYKNLNKRRSKIGWKGLDETGVSKIKELIGEDEKHRINKEIHNSRSRGYVRRSILPIKDISGYGWTESSGWE